MPASKRSLSAFLDELDLGATDFDVILADCLYFGFAATDDINNIEWNTNMIRQVMGVSTSVTGEDPQTASHGHHHGNGQQTMKAEQFKLSDGTPCTYVTTMNDLEEIMRHYPQIFGTDTEQSSDCSSAVTLDCEGIPYSLELIQIGTKSGVFLLDAQTIGVESLCQALEHFLTSPSTLKVLHDLREDAHALSKLGKVKLDNILDSQLVHEYLSGACHGGMNQFLENLGFERHVSKLAMGRQMDLLAPGQFWKERPLTTEKLDYAGMDVRCLYESLSKIHEIIPSEDLEMLKKASSTRAETALTQQAVRSIAFDTLQQYKLSSAELVLAQTDEHTSPTAVFQSTPHVDSDTDHVIQLLPLAFRKKLTPQDFPTTPTETALDLTGLTDVVLDQGRRPECWVDGQRVFLCDNPETIVSEQDIQTILNQIGEIGHDNRAGIDGQLHRFSVIRARNQTEIVGLTIRIGRSITGISDLLLDVLLGSDKSILLLGEPGSGKTTIVREAARLLSQEKNVMVVDTSSEIGGHGTKPHPCIGLARRMMVRSLEEQSRVMVECVQNHTPFCMIVDEIGRRQEVLAARTVRQRGVRIIASAHGDLRKLVQNHELRGLVGGVEQITLGDALAAKQALRKGPTTASLDGSVSKIKQERATDPTFDIIVELRRGLFDEWVVIPDVAKAVDVEARGPTDERFGSWSFGSNADYN